MAESHPHFLAEAIRLSAEALHGGSGGPFGAVVVKDNVIVGRGGNRVLSSNDPTAHAEVVAIREAAQRLGTFDLSGCTLYSSCEPCPMCLGAIYWSRIGTLYYANSRHEAAAIGFDDAFFYEELAKAPAQRQLLSYHWPSEAALGPFREWAAKTDRQNY